MHHIQAIIEKWKEVVEKELIPLVSKTGTHDHIHRNVYSNSNSVDYNIEFYESQFNLCYLSHSYDNCNILQIGFNYGFSALLILLANPTIEITCIDNNTSDHDDVCFEYIQRLFKDRIKLVKARHENVLSRLLNTNTQYDMIHIQTLQDINQILNYSTQLCRNKGALIMENVDHPEVNDVWLQFVRNTGLLEYNCPYLCPSRYQSVQMQNYSYKTAFYTIFCGTDSNRANRINEVPSKAHSCYYFTNNETTFAEAYSNGWIAVFLDTYPVSEDIVESSMQSKYMKACPGSNKILEKYHYTVYLDSKLIVTKQKILQLIDDYPEDKAYVILIHPYLSSNVWNEYIESLYQERYRRNKLQMINYIQEMLSYGFQKEFNHLYATGVIIRDMKHPKTKQIDSAWFTHIIKCGIECQISFFFVNQLFSSYITPPSNNIDYIST